MKEHQTKDFGIVLLTGLFLTGSAIAGESRFSSVTVGGLYTSSDSFKFGQYTGLEKKGGHFLADLDAKWRKESRYWNLQGSNLGFTSRNITAEYGNQGSYKLWVGYDQLPRFQTESAKTIFSGAGGTSLTLPAGWVSSGTTAGMTGLLGSLQSVNFSQERRRYDFGLSKIFSHGLDVGVGFQRDIKDGTKTFGAVIGNSGGNPRAVIIPEPVDYVTDQWAAHVGYTGSRAQARISYTLSRFEDRNTALTWANPFSAISGWASAAGYSTGQGRVALPPDNRAHQLVLDIGYNVGNATRITANFAKGRMTQDEDFLPYTVNPALTVTTPLPRSSLDGKINTTALMFKLASQPSSRFGWTTHYRLDDRRNRTPIAQYIYIGGDSSNQGSVTSDKARTNMPYSFRQNQFKVEGDYHLPFRTHLRGSYVLDVINRTFSEVKRTRENTYRLELKRGALDIFGGGIYAVIAKRNGTVYDATLPYYDSYSPEYINTVAANVRFGNHPLMRKFPFADRLRKQLGFWASCTPRSTLSVQANTSFNREDYTKTEIGLKDGDRSQVTLDAIYTPFRYVTTHAFYTNELFKTNQRGRSYSGGAVKPTQSNDPNRNWWQKRRDWNNTFGVGGELTGLRDRYDIGVEYLYAASRGSIIVTTGSALTPAAVLPLLSSKLHHVELYGKYKVTEALKAKLSYYHDRYHSRDWAYDNVNANTLANVILTGEENARYLVNSVGLSLNYDF